jgi:hypothetical protein
MPLREYQEINAIIRTWRVGCNIICIPLSRIRDARGVDNLTQNPVTGASREPRLRGGRTTSHLQASSFKIAMPYKHSAIRRTEQGLDGLHAIGARIDAYPFSAFVSSNSLPMAITGGGADDISFHTATKYGAFVDNPDP